MYTESIAFNQDESNALRNVSMWLALTSIGNSLKRSSSDGTLTVRSAPCIWAAQCQSPRFCLPQPIRTYAESFPQEGHMDMLMKDSMLALVWPSFVKARQSLRLRVRERGAGLQG